MLYHKPTPRGSDEGAGCSGGVSATAGGVKRGRELAKVPVPGEVEVERVALMPIDGRPAAGNATVGSIGSVLDKSDVSMAGSERGGSGPGERVVFHGLSKNMDGIFGRAFVVDHGFVEEDPRVYAFPVPRGDDGRCSCWS